MVIKVSFSALWNERAHRRVARKVMKRFLFVYEHRGLAASFNALIAHSSSHVMHVQRVNRSSALRAARATRLLRCVVIAWHGAIATRVEQELALKRCVESNVLRGLSRGWDAWRAHDAERLHAVAVTKRVIKLMMKSRAKIIYSGWMKWRSFTSSAILVAAHERESAIRIVETLLRQTREVCARRVASGWHQWRHFMIAARLISAREEHQLELRKRIVSGVVQRMTSARFGALSRAWTLWHKRTLVIAHDTMADGMESAVATAMVGTAAKLMRRAFGRKRKRHVFVLWEEMRVRTERRRRLKAAAAMHFRTALMTREFSALAVFVRRQHAHRSMINRAVSTYKNGGVAAAFRTLVEHSASHVARAALGARAQAWRMQREMQQARVVIQAWRTHVLMTKLAWIDVRGRFKHWVTFIKIRAVSRVSATRMASVKTGALRRACFQGWYSAAERQVREREAEVLAAERAVEQAALRESHSSLQEQSAQFALTALEALLRGRQRRAATKVLAVWTAHAVAARERERRVVQRLHRLVEGRLRTSLLLRARRLLTRWRVRAALLVPVGGEPCGICCARVESIVHTHDGVGICAECSRAAPVDLSKLDLSAAMTVCVSRVRLHQV